MTMPQGQDDAYLVFRDKVKDKNINEQTLLATDYLNHFNEIVMLLEMVPDMPECLDDAKDWTPRSYQDHFRASAFSEKDLAIAAYDAAPSHYREPFERTVDRLNDLVALSVGRIEAALASGDPQAISHTTQVATRALQSLMEVANAIIHGSEMTMEQDEIDALLGG